MADRKRILNLLLLALAALGLAAGLTARWAGPPGWGGQPGWAELPDWAGHPGWAGLLMAAGTVPVLAAVLVDSVAKLWRREIGLDIIALLSIGGALALGEYVTAAVIGVMLSGGRAMEDFAEARAQREMSALLSRVPRTANRYSDGQITTIPLDAVAADDRLLIRAGEAVPVDGVVASGSAVPRRVGIDR